MKTIVDNTNKYLIILIALVLISAVVTITEIFNKSEKMMMFNTNQISNIQNSCAYDELMFFQVLTTTSKNTNIIPERVLIHCASGNTVKLNLNQN